MPLYTDHLNLAKPTRDERYNIAVPNANMDILDELIQRLIEENQALREELQNKTSKSPVEMYDLPLAEGLTYFSDEQVVNKYGKDPFGLVTVHFCIRCEEGTFETGDNVVLAMLPEGFRPPRHVHTVTVGLISNYTSLVMLYVTQQGELISRITESGLRAIVGTINFYEH